MNISRFPHLCALPSSLKIFLAQNLPHSNGPSTTPSKATFSPCGSQDDMQQDAVDCAMHALDKYNIEKVSTD